MAPLAGRGGWRRIFIILKEAGAFGLTNNSCFIFLLSKQKVIYEIQKLDNENLIAEIYELLKNESEDHEVYILNPQQMAAIDEAQAQIKAGQ